MDRKNAYPMHRAGRRPITVFLAIAGALLAQPAMAEAGFGQDRHGVPVPGPSAADAGRAVPAQAGSGEEGLSPRAPVRVNLCTSERGQLLARLDRTCRDKFAPAYA